MLHNPKENLTERAFGNKADTKVITRAAAAMPAAKNTAVHTCQNLLSRCSQNQGVSGGSSSNIVL